MLGVLCPREAFLVPSPVYVCVPCSLSHLSPHFSFRCTLLQGRNVSDSLCDFLVPPADFVFVCHCVSSFFSRRSRCEVSVWRRYLCEVIALRAQDR